jgi:hypothetical protein
VAKASRCQGGIAISSPSCLQARARSPSGQCPIADTAGRRRGSTN